MFQVKTRWSSLCLFVGFRTKVRPRFSRDTSVCIAHPVPSPVRYYLPGVQVNFTPNHSVLLLFLMAGPAITKNTALCSVFKGSVLIALSHFRRSTITTVNAVPCSGIALTTAMRISFYYVLLEVSTGYISAREARSNQVYGEPQQNERTVGAWWSLVQ